MVTNADERRERNLESLRTYFTLLEQKDLDTWITLWSHECRQRIPYATGDLPAQVDTRDEIHALYQRIADGYVRLRFTLVELNPMHDPDKVFARWSPRCEMNDGSVYTNESIGLFEFDADGKIQLFTEYFNPLGFLKTFATF
jgi:ketosteroid isomerase-like protein